jgi:hypothetical protein
MTGMLVWDYSPLPKATMCELLIPLQRLELGILWIRKQGNQNVFEHTGECARSSFLSEGKFGKNLALLHLILLKGRFGIRKSKYLCNIIDYIDISRNTSELRTCIQRLCHQSSFAHTGLSELQVLMEGNLLRRTCWFCTWFSAANWNTLRFCLAQDGASGQRREIPILEGRCGVLHKLDMLKARNRVTSAIKHTTSRNTWEHA